MALLDDWRGKLAKATQTITQTSGDLYKTTKMNLALGTEEENLKKLYVEIGKKVHEIYQYGGSLGKFFDEKYKEIAEVETRIEELKKQLEEIRQTKICPKCGKETDKKAVFCPKCGSGLDNTSSPPSQMEAIDIGKLDRQIPEEQSNVQVKICPTCKAENQSGDKFCLSCGRAIF